MLIVGNHHLLADARFENSMIILLYNKLLLCKKYSFEQQTSNKIFLFFCSVILF